jgi:hypothetical protein
MTARAWCPPHLVLAASSATTDRSVERAKSVAGQVEGTKLVIGFIGQIRLENDAQTGDRILQYQGGRNRSRWCVFELAMAVEESPGRLGELVIGIFSDLIADCGQEALQRQGDKQEPGEGQHVPPGRNDLHLGRNSASG